MIVHPFMLNLLECSAVMSILSLVYMAALPFLSKRYTAQWLYYIWIFFVIGWIVPFRPYFDFAFVNVEMPLAASSAIVDSMAAGQEVDQIAGWVVGQTSGSDISAMLWGALTGIWLVGAAAVLFVNGRRHWRLMKMVERWSEKVVDPAVVGIVQAVKTELKIGRSVRISICQAVATPMLVGLFRPVVLLPSIRLDSEELTFILKHELVHLKRGDLWFKLSVMLATALHWFNPVVYLVVRSLAAQCELACDERVLQGASIDQRKRYGETIIRIIRHRVYQSALTTSFSGGRQGMKTRFLSIMDTTKKKAGVVIVSVAIAVVIGAGAILSVNFPIEGTAEDQTRRGVEEQVRSVESGGSAEVPAPAAVEGGSIRTSDGKELLIQLAAGTGNNFGKTARVNGEKIIFSVECDKARELEIGIISADTGRIYSQIVNVGTGVVEVAVPADGDYRIYVHNHANEAAQFRLTLNKPIDAPLV